MSYQEGETIYGFDISSLYSMWKREKDLIEMEKLIMTI